MQYDVFFSICQTPVNGHTPSEKEMFQNFFDQVKWADELGYGTAWVAETHLSCQTQKENPDHVIPEFQGEIGLNTDILQVAHKVFAQTKNIHVGSAIRNILCNGGPIAHAEAIKTFLSLHSLNKNEKRKLHIGFAAGRFPFSNTPYGIVPRNKLEQEAWSAVKRYIFLEAVEIFLRLLKGEKLSSKDITRYELSQEDFQSEEAWEKAKNNSLALESRWKFDKLGVIPFEAPLENLELTIGSHDPKAQILANKIFPCGVFNLSITPFKDIEKTHQRMETHYQGKWARDKMPRTTLIFINGDENLSVEEQIKKAKEQAQEAHKNYWQAMEKTLSQEKVDKAVENTIYGNPKKVAEEIKKQYHPEERLMLWFDFNNHDNEAVKKSMSLFKKQVAPLLDN